MACICTPEETTGSESRHIPHRHTRICLSLLTFTNVLVFLLWSCETTSILRSHSGFFQSRVEQSDVNASTAGFKRIMRSIQNAQVKINTRGSFWLNRKTIDNITVNCSHFKSWQDETQVYHPAMDNEAIRLVRSQKHVIFLSFAGRLANFINQMCSLYLLANQTGHIFITEAHPYFSWFPYLVTNIVSKEVFDELILTKGLKHRMITGHLRRATNMTYEAVRKLATHGSIWIKGQFFSKCLRTFEDQGIPIKDIFQFSESVYETAQILWDYLNLKFVAPYLREENTTIDNLTYVAVHNRRGDFIGRFNNLPNASHFLTSMKSFEKRYQHVFFVMATDDTSWARANLLSKKPNMIVVSEFTPEDDPRLDVALLTKCKHTIHSKGSTFGMLIGFLVGGEVQIV